MRNFIYNAAHRRRVAAFDRLIQLGYSQAPDDRLLFFRIPDRASVILNLDRSAVCCFCFLYHDLYGKSNAFQREALMQEPRLAALLSCAYTNSSTCLPRSLATSSGSFIRDNPSNVARTTLWLLRDPRILVRTL